MESEEFVVMGWDAVETHTPDDLWIVPEMIANTSTLLYGESESGKSFLAASLAASLATGAPFLGRPIVGGPYRVAIGYTDDQGDREYKTRIQTALTEGESPDVGFFRVPVMRSPSQWSRLLAGVREWGADVLIVDNMSQAADGDLNTHPAVRDFFEGARTIVEAGIPVIVVGHSTQKASPHGGKSELPMGHSAIVQSVRWRVFVKRYADDTIKLTFAGNSARKHDVTVSHGQGANFTITEQRTADERDAATAARSAEVYEENREIARFVVRECQDAGINEAAKRIASKFAKGESTAKKKIQNNGPVRKQLHYDEQGQAGSRWSFADAA